MDSSNKEMKLRVLEMSQVSPSSPTTESTLPLTYFDLPYLLRAPPELLLFYTIPNIEITQFMNSVVPQIKHSLSQTLNHYYPLAGNLIWSQQSNQPIIRCSHGDFVKLTVAQTNADFNHLSGYHSRDPKHLQKLVPHLTDSTSLNTKSDNNGFPVFALQVTLFPSFGITLGASFHHCAMDGRSTAMFLKSWASISRSRNNSLVLNDESFVLPFIDKSLMKRIDSKFKKLCLQELVKFIRSTKSMSEHDCNNWLLLSMNLNTPPDQVMATFEVLGADLDGLKRWVSSRTARPNPSRFELVCTFIWVCLAKAKTNITNVTNVGGGEEEEMSRITFAADFRARLDPPVPSTYFGNCLIRVEVSAKRSDLLGENGIVVALDMIMKEKKELGASFIRNVEARIASNAKGPQRYDGISGSPQFRFYDLDFGWGRPMKVELVVIARTGAIFLAESRNGGDKGGIEISLARSRDEMESFKVAFVNGLNDLRIKVRGVKSAL